MASKSNFPKLAQHSAGNAFSWMQHKLDILKGHLATHSLLVFFSIPTSAHASYCTFLNKAKVIWSTESNIDIEPVCLWLRTQMHKHRWMYEICLFHMHVCVTVGPCGLINVLNKCNTYKWEFACVHVRVYVHACCPVLSLANAHLWFFQTFVFLIYFTSKGHMKSCRPSSIWALIEGETDKQRDKGRELERGREREYGFVYLCVCVCVCVCVCL